MNKKKPAVDIALCCLLPLLMAYSLIGETVHEVLGTLMLLLVMWHHVLNRKWFQAIPHGHYRPNRIFRTALDMLLLVIMLAQPISGILMSKHLYTFLPFTGLAADARQVHLALAYWCFVLTCVHAGTHLAGLWNRMRAAYPARMRALLAAVLPVSLYGCFAFFANRLPGYMFLQVGFAFIDPDGSLLHFFADYLSMMILFGGLGMLAARKIPS